MTEAEIRELAERIRQKQRNEWSWTSETQAQMREWLKDLPERLQEEAE